MSKEWRYHQYPSVHGVPMAAIREYDGQPGSRFVCEATLSDAERIVSNHNTLEAAQAEAARLREELEQRKAYEHVFVIVGDKLARRLEWMVDEPTSSLVPEVLDAIKERSAQDVAQWLRALRNAGFVRPEEALAPRPTATVRPPDAPDR